MKYYSDVTQALYENEDDLKAAELRHWAKKAEEKRRTEQAKEDAERRAREMNADLDKINQAYKNINKQIELAENLVEKFRAKYKDEDAQNELFDTLVQVAINVLPEGF